MDASNSAQSGGVFEHQLIEQVHEGMTVIDSSGKDIGKVELVRMGDPEAITTMGQGRSVVDRGLVRDADRVPLLGDDDDDDEPEVPRAERSSMLRMGFFKVESGGVLGIGETERYVRADLIASVEGDRVRLAVAEHQLPHEADDHPLDTD